MEEGSDHRTRLVVLTSSLPMCIFLEETSSRRQPHQRAHFARQCALFVPSASVILVRAHANIFRHTHIHTQRHIYAAHTL